MNSIIDSLFNVPTPIAYTVIALLVFAEAAVFVGFVLPGETAVLVGGALAASGRLSLSLVMIVVVAAAILGDSVGFEVGRRFGTRLLAARALRRHRRAVDRAQRFLRDRGGWAVFLGRFTAFFRAVMPALAGTSGMAYPRFVAFNAAGALVWGPGAALLGFLAGTSYAAVAKSLGRGSAVLIVVVLAAALVLWHRDRGRRPVDGAEPVEPVEAVEAGAARAAGGGSRCESVAGSLVE